LAAGRCGGEFPPWRTWGSSPYRPSPKRPSWLRYARLLRLPKQAVAGRHMPARRRACGSSHLLRPAITCALGEQTRQPRGSARAVAGDIGWTVSVSATAASSSPMRFWSSTTCLAALGAAATAGARSARTLSTDIRNSRSWTATGWPGGQAGYWLRLVRAGKGVGRGIRDRGGTEKPGCVLAGASRPRSSMKADATRRSLYRGWRWASPTVRPTTWQRSSRPTFSSRPPSLARRHASSG
jgi:hypothetical protein